MTGTDAAPRRGAILAALWPWIALPAVCVGGDALIDWRVIPRIVQAFLDPLVHGAVGVLIVHVAARARPAWRARDVLAGALLAVVIDFDHVVAARSLNPSAWISLPMRPASHSLTFAALAAALLGGIGRSASSAAIVFAALASHVVRDASSGITPLLYPSLALLRVPYPAYLVAEVAIALALWRVAPRSAPRWGFIARR